MAAGGPGAEEGPLRQAPRGPRSAEGGEGSCHSPPTEPRARLGPAPPCQSRALSHSFLSAPPGSRRKNSPHAKLPCSRSLWPPADSDDRGRPRVGTLAQNPWLPVEKGCAASTSWPGWGSECLSSEPEKSRLHVVACDVAVSTVGSRAHARGPTALGGTWRRADPGVAAWPGASSRPQAPALCAQSEGRPLACSSSRSLSPPPRLAPLRAGKGLLE